MISYSKTLKQKARRLRKTGLSYGEIGKRLNLAKSTIKLWCDDVELNEEQKKKLYTKQIKQLMTGPNSSKERRQKEIDKVLEDAEKEIKLPINQEAYRLMGAALYWGEGSKTIDFNITNSDPLLVSFMVHWMQDILNINPKNLKAHLNIYPQQNESEIKQFWSKITGIPIKNFGKSFIKPLSTGYKKNNLYHGTIKVRCKNGSDIRHRVSGWINTVLQDEKIKINKKVVWNN